ncbi:hypothetical protein AB6A40_007416 [Gnathostoma spinigerum]|uniref:Uncharacterized protein n=1 Tax=Gnathostoma spinigerum TaxID=75299 RepID=A0ABD6EVV3_9BILA
MRQLFRFLTRCLKCNVIPRHMLNKTQHLLCGDSILDQLIRNVQNRYLALDKKDCQRRLGSSITSAHFTYLKAKSLLNNSQLIVAAKLSSQSCKTVSFDSKSRFVKKLNYLRSCKSSSHPSPTPPPISPNYSVTESTPIKTRVICIGNISLEQPSSSLLSLGPSFALAIRMDVSTANRIRANLIRS